MEKWDIFQWFSFSNHLVWMLLWEKRHRKHCNFVWFCGKLFLIWWGVIGKIMFRVRGYGYAFWCSQFHHACGLCCFGDPFNDETFLGWAYILGLCERPMFTGLRYEPNGSDGPLFCSILISLLEVMMQCKWTDATRPTAHMWDLRKLRNFSYFFFPSSCISFLLPLGVFIWYFISLMSYRWD